MCSFTINNPFPVKFYYMSCVIYGCMSSYETLEMMYAEKNQYEQMKKYVSISQTERTKPEFRLATLFHRKFCNPTMSVLKSIKEICTYVSFPLVNPSPLSCTFVFFKLLMYNIHKSHCAWEIVNRKAQITILLQVKPRTLTPCNISCTFVSFIGKCLPHIGVLAKLERFQLEMQKFDKLLDRRKTSRRL